MANITLTIHNISHQDAQQVKQELQKLIDNWNNPALEPTKWANPIREHRIQIHETRTNTLKETNAEDYLKKHAILDGQGNMDGSFVPMSVAMIAINECVNGRMKAGSSSHVKEEN